jgi:hypothetical protein
MGQAQSTNPGSARDNLAPATTQASWVSPWPRVSDATQNSPGSGKTDGPAADMDVSWEIAPSQGSGHHAYETEYSPEEYLMKIFDIQDTADSNQVVQV